jgi:prepilin-type N-terminal cleavage/methylation domain-containing protein
MKSNKSNYGFTLIELIMVILLVGILSAVVVPNLNLDSYRQTGGFQQGIAMIRFGQKQAISSGCQVNVSVGSSSCTLVFDCTGDDIPNPGTGDNNFCSDSNPGVSPAETFSFNNIGAPIGGVQTITFAGGQIVTVEANTGFVYE